MTLSFDLAGRAALVTGAGVGLGRAVAVALGRAGAFVGIHYHSSGEGAAETLAEIGGQDKGMVLQADLTREEDANALVDRFVDRAGRLDVLVNNAGALIGRARIEECTLELWRQTLDANLTSAFLVTRRAIPHLRKAVAAPGTTPGSTPGSTPGTGTGGSSVVNIISLSTQTGGANGAGAYAVSKGGLQVFTRTLARELAPAVRVNAVCPGVIETRHHAVASTPERMAEYRKQTPLGRNGVAEEVAGAVLYLVSPAAAFTTGAIIDVNGGRFLR